MDETHENGPEPAPGIPAEILAVVAGGGERTMEAAVALFGLMGFPHPRPGEAVLRIPASFLGGLAFVHRAHRWEAGGFFEHRALGLPTAADLLGELMRLAAGPSWDGLDRFFRSLIPGFVAVAHRFAAQGHRLLGAEVALGEPDEDALVEALAQLCWANRERRADDDAERL